MIVAVEFVVARLALSRFRLMLVRLRAVLDGTQILFAPLSRIEGRKEKKFTRVGPPRQLVRLQH